MSDTATSRQKQYLRQLGCKDVAKLSKQQASQLIDQLIAQEKASGKTFSCPYCKSQFGPRPKRTKTCPSCGQTIVHLSGKFYTQHQVDNLNQKEWLAESLANTKSEVKDDWKEERKYRKEFGEALILGYQITAGDSCPHTKPLENGLVLIEDAFDNPELLPPFDECRHDSCECDFSSVMGDEAPRRLRIIESSDKSARSKLVTRQNSPYAAKGKTSGCASVLGVCFLLIAVCSCITLL
ncbi:MAG: hypothetical protein WD851_23560 [Pirellulales bacterium]